MYKMVATLPRPQCLNLNALSSFERLSERIDNTG